MKNALINLNEKIFNPNTGEEIGARVCDVENTPFEVHPSLLWIQCDDSVNPDDWYYDPNSKTFKKKPEWIPPVADNQPTSSGTNPL